MKRFVLLLVSLFAGVAAWSADVTLSEDNDFVVGRSGRWYVNMPTNATDSLTLTAADLTACGSTFKVYDDGGKNGDYSTQNSSSLVITVPEGLSFQVTGTIWIEGPRTLSVGSTHITINQDRLHFHNGVNNSQIGLYWSSDADGAAKSVGPVICEGNVIKIFFVAGGSAPYAGLDLIVTVGDMNAEYAVSTTNPSHGTIAVDKATAKVGDTVTVTPIPDADFAPAEVSYDDGTKHVITPANGIYSFVMPLKDVTVDAVFWDDVMMLWGLSAWADVEINETNFPDDNFRNWLLEQYYGEDGVLTNGEIAGITKIDVCNNNIADLTGIEHFTALTSLDCSNNRLTTLDVSHNTALATLYCESNELKSLNVSHNTALKRLYCNFNFLKSLDVSHNTELTSLDCSSNDIQELDVSHNTELTSLDCSSNDIQELDVRHNTALRELRCNSNQMKSLDVSLNTALTDLNCSVNQLDTLDMSLNTELTHLDCSSNELKSLNVSLNTELTQLDCHSNPLKALDVSHNTALTDLDCYRNQLTALDVSRNTALTDLDCYRNQLTALDVSRNTALRNLDCSDNQINGVNMEALVVSLHTVDVNNNWGWNGELRVIDLDSETEQNIITPSQVTMARGKNWTVLGFTNYRWEEYDGSTAYAISLPASFEHGTVTCDKQTAFEGETVTLTVTPDEGYELETLTVTFAGDDEPSGAPMRLRGGTVELTPGTEPNTYTFEMPDAPVTVNATFMESVPTSVAGLRSDKPVVVIYNLAGMRVNHVGSGVYIVKYADGTIAKVRF